MADMNQLQHEILGVLKRIAMKITAHGSQAEGMTAIHKIIPESAILQFGVLVALVNNSDKYNTPPPGQSTFPNQWKFKREQVEDNKYSFDDVATAVETLEFNEDVKDLSGTGALNLEDRQIQITKKGIVSFNTQFYLKADLADAINESALSTNRAVQRTAKATVLLFWATLLVVLATVLPAVISYLTDARIDGLKAQNQLLIRENDSLRRQLQPPH
jgi:hypothetical protein